MRPLVGFAEAKALDAAAFERYGLSDDVLMEAAAIGMAAALEADPESIRALDHAALPLVALAGSGGNGGDALAVARRLAYAGRSGLVAVVAPEPGPIVLRRLAEARLAGVVALDPGDSRAAAAVAEAGIVLDGVAGIGYRGSARPTLRRLKALAAAGEGRVVAVDVPSGLAPWSRSAEGLAEAPEPPVRARLSLSVAPLKAETFFPGNRAAAGRVVPITGVFPAGAGRDAPAWLLEAADLASLLPPLDPDCHKGQRGALAAFAGSPGSVGAASLCARAAQAAGTGSVTLLVDDDLEAVLGARLETQMVRRGSNPGSRRFSACLAGPGWGRGPERDKTLTELWNAALPLALDADALWLLAESGRKRRCSPLVLTPHPGEFAPLAALAMGASPRDEAALSEAAMRARFDTASILSETAASLGAVITLKGSVTWIGDPEGRLAVWDGREPTLAVAGSGDVLAGLSGGFLARGASAWDAARAAVLVHALAGSAARTRGFYEAGELIPEAARLAYAGGVDGNQG